MNKRTTKTIEILNNYITELTSVSNQFEGNTWKAIVRDTFVLYIGEEAAVTKRLDKLYFTDKVTKAYTGGAIGLYTDHVYNPNNKENFKALLNAAIQHVQQNGVKSDHVKTNFLSQFSTTQILGGLLTIATLIFWFGWFVGSSQKDREIIRIEQELTNANQKLEELKDKDVPIDRDNKILKSESTTHAAARILSGGIQN